MPDKMKPDPSYRDGDARANIPTAALESFVRDEETTPSTVLYPRNASLDPPLVRKGKDEFFDAKRAGQEAVAPLRHALR